MPPQKKTKKTAKRQKRRKVQGNIAENLVKKDLKSYLPAHYSYSINRNVGIDIYAKDGQTLNIEVKSAKQKILQKKKNGYRQRVGTFQLKPDDYIHSDFFGFVIKEVDEKAKWNGKTKIHYVDSRKIEEYVRRKGKLGKPIKISIHQLKEIPKMRMNSRRW